MARTNLAARASRTLTQPLCGCWYPLPRPDAPHHIQRSYLPLHSLQAHTIIKDVASRTVLTQTFSNGSNEHLEDMVYSFPLYDGVSVVSFMASIGDVRIHGIVKEKQQARREYHDAVENGLSAGLLEQLPQASDVFVTTIGNVPAGATVIMEVIYIGELRHDAESNGIRFTIPSSIAPRYGTTPDDILASSAFHETADVIQVTVDFQSPEQCPIQQIQSPSHPITVSIGRTTNMPSTAYMANRGSATLSLDATTLDNDFVIIVGIKGADIPKALLETHTTIANQRALMATLVPRFNITPTYGEIVFIVDRSASMEGKINMVIQAMTIMLKSLPEGTKFNICSFGSHHSFLWPRSKSYNDANLNEALNHIDKFDARLAGTEIYQPVKATISQRFSDMLLDVIILTDGQIWNQERLFDMIQKASTDYKCRFFSLGIGSGASTALVEGIATAGNGFSQFVAEGEKMNMKMVRLLKGALTPHIDDYSLEVKYKQDNEDFEIIESAKAASKVDITLPPANVEEAAPKPPISFFDNKLDPDSDGDVVTTSTKTNNSKFAHLPVISPPSLLQAPFRVPPLYSFSRTTVYILLDPSTYHKTPEAIILRATCSEGPLELEVEVEDIGKGETIHQLAAKKAVSELENNSGWLAAATNPDGTLIKNKHDGRWEEIVECEAVRLGVKYSIAGKWCSFVAVEGDVEHEAVVFGGVIPPTPARFQRAECKKAPPCTKLASRAPRHSVADHTPARSREVLSLRPTRLGMKTKKRKVEAEILESIPVLKAFNLASGSLISDAPRRTYVESYNDKMHEIIRLQKFDGFWEWDEHLTAIMGIGLNPERQDAILATALAIAFLQNRMAHEAESWELIVEKARNWLGRQDGIDVETEIYVAEKLLGSE